MKTAKLVAVALVIMTLMAWSREGRDFTLPMTLPFMHGLPINNIFDAAGLAALAMGLAGLMRLNRNRRDRDN